jgi:elongation factor P hydroxylase
LDQKEQSMTQLAANTTSAPGTGNTDDRRLAEAIEETFAQCFAQDYGTELVGGALEPLYQPGSLARPARLLYREDFPASALHEVAHWCVAGEARRKLEDFGYLYIAGPRTPDQQATFFALELRAQSLEKQFAESAGLEFLPSADNLHADLNGFGGDIVAYEPQLLDWLARPAGARARRFIQGLKSTFRKRGEEGVPKTQRPERHLDLNDLPDRGTEID